jgi:hypothetical protein
MIKKCMSSNVSYYEKFTLREVKSKLGRVNAMNEPNICCHTMLRAEGGAISDNVCVYLKFASIPFY